jgi:hypothetical protein
VSLREIIKKIWGNPPEMQPWTHEECDLINRYFAEYDYGLVHPSGADDQVDPRSIVFDRLGVSTPFGGVGGNLNYIHRSLLVEIIPDFVDELLLFNQHHSIKGSAQCRECGQMYPRSFYGHGQKYCSAQCKNRSNKRTQRERRNVRTFLRRSEK